MILDNLHSFLTNLHADKKRVQRAKTKQDKGERERRIQLLEKAYQEEQERVIQFRMERGLSKEKAAVCEREVDWEICADLQAHPIEGTAYFMGDYTAFFKNCFKNVPRHFFTDYTNWTLFIKEGENVVWSGQATISWDFQGCIFSYIQSKFNLSLGADRQFTAILTAGRENLTANLTNSVRSGKIGE